MLSSAQKGAYWKARTRKWLVAQGYQVGDLEIVHWIFTKGGRIPTKRDQFGSDLLAVSLTEVVFVQVKGGRTGGTFPEARRKFAEFQFPPSTQQWVVAWAPRARKPVVVDCTRGEARTISKNLVNPACGILREIQRAPW